MVFVKKTFIALLIFCLFFSIIAPGLSESAQLNLLWGIEFGKSAYQVKSLVLEGRGIDCRLVEHDKSRFVPFSYSELDSINDDEITLYGYNFHFHYTDYGIGNNRGSFDLQIRPTGDWYDRCTAVTTILHGLIDKYGNPDFAMIGFYSHGYDAWFYKTVDSVHQISEVSLDTIQNFDADQLLSEWEYSDTDTEMYLWVRFNNIAYIVHFNSKDSDKSDICIYFYSCQAVPPDAVFESVEAKVIPEMDNYGF